MNWSKLLKVFEAGLLSAIIIIIVIVPLNDFIIGFQAPSGDLGSISDGLYRLLFLLIIDTITFSLYGGLISHIFGSGWKKAFFLVFTVSVLLILLTPTFLSPFVLRLVDLYGFSRVQNILDLYKYSAGSGLTIFLVLVLLFKDKKVKAKAIVLSLGFMFIIGFLIPIVPLNNRLLSIALTIILLPLSAGFPLGIYNRRKEAGLKINLDISKSQQKEGTPDTLTG